MKNKQKVILSTAGFLCLVIITIGVSYAFFDYSKEGSTMSIVTAGNLKFLYTEISGVGNGISIMDALPISDREGRAQSGEGKVFDFKVEAKTPGTASIPYEITGLKTEDSTLDDSVVRLYLTEADGTEIETPLTKTGVKYNSLSNTAIPGAKGKTIYKGEVPENSVNYLKNFKLRMWVDENTDFSTGNYNGKTFTLKVNVYAGAEPPDYVDASGASKPELLSGMIPVTYDEMSGNWETADTKSAWYNYAQKEWANTVTVKESGTKSREYYQTAEVGTEIPMDDILQMLVWIPRYKYAMPAAKEGQVDIVFENNKTAKSTGTATGSSYLTHPAFTFGDSELNGIWVAKFEPTADVNCTAATGSIGTGCDLATMKPTIKPNQLAWTGARLSTFSTVAQNMHLVGNIYGYSTTGTDTRVARNEEWGAAAYLTQSKYGRCTGNTCEEVTINHINTGDYRGITGCAGDTVSAEEVTSDACPVTNQYNTEKGVKASTTGNVYGIYDMSGGSWEYVMSVYNKISGTTLTENSGYTGSNYDGSTTNGIVFPEDKYLNNYTTKDIATACGGKVCYGQALSETAGWYGSNASFFSGTPLYPWLMRGGPRDKSERAGIFSFEKVEGFSAPYLSFRLVVSGE